MEDNITNNDFNLTITHSKDNIFKLFSESPEGKSEGVFYLPFEEQELEEFLIKLEERDYEENELKDFGKKLYNELFSDKIKFKYFKSTKNLQKPLNLKLNFDESAQSLINLPWELLHDGSHFLASSGEVNIVRYIGVPKIKIETIKLPFKILLIISRPFSDSSDEISYYNEHEAIIKGLYSLQKDDNVIIDVISPPTLNAVIEKLSNQRYDAIHFDGHGGFFDNKGHLLFENEFMEEDVIDSESFANTVLSTNVKLVTLSACQSSKADINNIFAGTTQALLKAKIPIVVSMQFSIGVDSAVTFANHFYSSISKFNSIGNALIQGRKALFPKKLNKKSEWFVPTLYLCTETDNFFDKNSEVDLSKINKSNFILNEYEIPYFVGREKEIIDLSKMVSLPENRVIFVWGIGGIGKTTLVKSYIERQRWRFPDGIIWINLRDGGTLESVVNQISSFLGVETTQSIHEKIEIIRGILSGKNVLIIFDNFEEIENDNRIQEFISKIPFPSKVIITSIFHPYVIGWKSFEINELRKETTVKLFFKMGMDFGKQFKEAECFNIEKICELLEGHPQAISLVIPMTLGVSISRILQELKEKPLKGIELALDVSFDKLSENAKDMLKKVSVFKSRFNEDAIKSVCEISNILDITTELRRKSFLQFDGDQYSLHSVIKQYAYFKLDNKESIHLLAAKYYEGINEYFSQFDHLYDANEFLDACKLFSWLIDNYLRNIAELDSFFERIDQVSIASKKTDEDEAEFIINRGIGDIYWESGNYSKSLLYYNICCEYAKQKNNLEWYSDALIVLARNYTFLNDWEEGISFLNKSLEVAKNLDSKTHLAFITASSGDIYLKLSDINDFLKHKQQNKEKCIKLAIAKYEEVIKLIENLDEQTINDLFILSQAYTNIGINYSSEKPKKAIKYLKTALEIKNQINEDYNILDNSGITLCFNYLIDSYINIKDYVKAQEFLKKTLYMATEVINIYGLIPKTLVKAAKLCYYQKNYNESKYFLILACQNAIHEKGMISEILDLIEEHIDELNQEHLYVTTLVRDIIRYWEENNLVDIYPEVKIRLQSKIDNI